MRLDKFTIKAQEALQTAQGMADRLGHQEVLPDADRRRDQARDGNDNY